jgi:hypothetical protein
MALIPNFQGGNNLDTILENASSGALAHIPDGEYVGIIVKSDMKDTKSGGKYLQLDFVITQGAHNGTELTERLNLVNSNEKAVAIAFESLARIAKAAGFATMPQDSSALHGKPMKFKTKTEEGKPYMDNNGQEQQGKPRSVIDSRSYAALPAAGGIVGVAQATQAPASSMPWLQQ